MERVKSFLKWLRSCITPGYVAMLVAAFILWYMTKLGETYTTEHKVEVVVDGQSLDVDCTIKGKGTNLIGYTLTSKRNTFEVPASELSFEAVVVGEDGKSYRNITTTSMQRALSSRMADIEVTALGEIPPFEVVAK